MAFFDLKPFEHFLGKNDEYFARAGVRGDPLPFLRDLQAAAKDTKALQRYAEACPVTGASPHDYAPRMLELTPDCSVIARIHFRGLNRLAPFVDVSAQSGALPSSLGALRRAFALFRPHAVRIWHAPDEPAPSNGRPDLIVVAGHIPSLLNLPPPANSERITLKPDPTLDCYTDYVATYEALHRLDPSLADLSEPEDRDSLRACAEANAFFRVLVDARPAGFVAACPDSFRLWSGWSIVEQVLEPNFRGLGLAPALQRALLTQLDLSRAATVFGTIDARNTPSLKTALRVGRRAVEMATFLPLD